MATNMQQIMDALVVNQTLHSLIDIPDYREFLLSLTPEELKSFGDVLMKHAGAYLAYSEAKQKKAEEEFISKITKLYEDDPDLAKALARLIKGDFDKSKLSSFEMVIMPLPEKVECDCPNCSAEKCETEASTSTKKETVPQPERAPSPKRETVPQPERSTSPKSEPIPDHETGEDMEPDADYTGVEDDLSS